MISAHGLARTFKTRAATVEAVRGIDFEVAAGEIVGLLGPNGAGKTTTQRMLSTLLVPTAGEATVAGCDLRRDPIGVWSYKNGDREISRFDDNDSMIENPRTAADRRFPQFGGYYAIPAEGIQYLPKIEVPSGMR